MRTYPNLFRKPEVIVLMIWPSNPRKRKKSKNVVNLNILKGLPLEVGDKIIGLKVGGDESKKHSCYTVESLVGRRRSSLKGYEYCELFCSWTAEKVEIETLPKPVSEKEELFYQNHFA